MDMQRTTPPGERGEGGSGRYADHPDGGGTVLGLPGPRGEGIVNALERLQDWYVAQCDGTWENDRGITVETLDNPGWKVVVDLTGTDLENAPFEDFVVERLEDDWVHARAVDTGETAVRRRFEAFCGPRSLAEALDIFLDWAEFPEG